MLSYCVKTSPPENKNPKGGLGYMPGTHQIEPLSPLIPCVNPFPSEFSFKNIKISAVRSLADICFLHVSLRICSCIPAQFMSPMN